MGTEKHSKASRNRWKRISKEDRRVRMAAMSSAGWERLDVKARRRRALKGVRTRRAKLLNVENLHESTN